MSELDKTYHPKEVEERYYAFWEESGAFACDPQSNARPYVIMMPPPNVTGSLHMGHALTFTIQDVLIRWHRMSGQDAFWQPGMDHAGIATQMVVERQLAAQDLHRRDMGREAFVERVWQWKEESGGTITRQLRRLGASADWARERFTMDDGLSEAVRKVFVQLFKEGLIYRDKRLVNWDPKLHTAISDLEVQQKEVKGKLWHFRYPIEGEEGRYIVVATTRPETMLGDTAVAVHPDDERYKDLVGRHCVLPLVGRRMPIVADLHADPEAGSGAVKITPAHDFNDFEVGRRHDLIFINIFDENACLNDEVPAAYRGMARFAAREKVVADIEALGLLDQVEDHTHSVPHGDRSGVVIEPWLTDQWYCDAKTLAEPCIKAVEDGRTRFVPKQWENTYFEWMRNIQPWCISRQLWWGHQIPAWYGPDGQVFVEETEEEALKAAEAHYGRPTTLERDGDVLDTWFSSALWPFSTLGWPSKDEAVQHELERYYPGSVLVTGFDIIFFWVARMMMMGMHFMGDVPFRDVYIHALVRDQHGQKMSKSKGNIIDPLELIDSYGSDALRFTLASLAVPGRDIKLSADRAEGYRNFTTKLWNAARFCLMNQAKVDEALKPEALEQTLNRWLVGKVVALRKGLDASISAYRLNDAASQLYHFTWAEFCDWYIELSKPILTGPDEAAADEVRRTTGWALNHLLRLLHPFMPFVTSALWEHFRGASAPELISAELPEFDETIVDREAAEEIDWVIRLISEVRAVRAEMNVPPAAIVPLAVRDADAISRKRLDTHEALISRLARVKRHSDSGDGNAAGTLQILLGEATFLLPLADVIDISAERGRLERELEKARQELIKIDRKLGNEQFIAKAPVEVVEENRERREEAALMVGKLEAAVTRLAAA